MAPLFTEAEAAPRPASRSSQATQLPPRSYVDESVADWEAEHLFLGGWVCVGHAQPLAERGRFVTRQIKDESFLFVGDDEGRAHGFFNVCRHRGARLVERARGHDAPPPVPVPRLVLRLRRQPQQRAAHRGDRELRPRHLGPQPPAHGGGPRPPVRRRLRHRRPARRAPRRARRRTSSATASATCTAPPRSPTTSRPTGRRSSRTTPSACTARACTPSSTASRTT